MGKIIHIGPCSQCRRMCCVQDHKLGDLVFDYCKDCIELNQDIDKAFEAVVDVLGWLMHTSKPERKR